VRVLVVEDVPRLANDIAEGLRDQSIAVDVAYDGLDATAKLNLNRCEVVILDRDIPEVHGDVVCRMITESDDPAMVLMLTAADAPGDRVKPFNFTELVLRVRNLARRRPTTHPRILRAADIELDPARRTVTRAGQERDMSAKEFAVLEALMRAAPATLSTEDLLEQVWDENADPFTKTVQVTLARLRRKLGAPDAIETLRGVGYRIDR
jgi:DNA-binding response OmpR family regulator